jgi:hypothetical protein
MSSQLNGTCARGEEGKGTPGVITQRSSLYLLGLTASTASLLLGGECRRCVLKGGACISQTVERAGTYEPRHPFLEPDSPSLPSPGLVLDGVHRVAHRVLGVLSSMGDVLASLPCGCSGGGEQARGRRGCEFKRNGSRSHTACRKGPSSSESTPSCGEMRVPCAPPTNAHPQ